MKQIIMTITMISILFFLIIGCSPEIGSEAWCKKLSEKPKGDWTAIETKDYAKNCLFK